MKSSKAGGLLAIVTIAVSMALTPAAFAKKKKTDTSCLEGGCVVVPSPTAEAGAPAAPTVDPATSEEQTGKKAETKSKKSKSHKSSYKSSSKESGRSGGDSDSGGNGGGSDE